MRAQQTLLGLPTAALLLLPLLGSAQAQTQETPGRQPQIIPLAIRKMGLDDGEKFYPEQYYGFDMVGDDGEGAAAASGAVTGETAAERRRRDRTDSVGRSLAALFSLGRRTAAIATAPETSRQRQRDDARAMAEPLAANGTEAVSTPRLFPQAFSPAYPVHEAAEDVDDDGGDGGSAASAWEVVRRAAEALARLQRRQWACPSGTTSCTDIGYPYSCCKSDETCYKVTDTGLGPVGCCPSGETCGGAVSSCATGTTACPSSLGGGCCIAGYECAGVGCVKSGSVSSTSTSTSTSPSASTRTTTTTTRTAVATAAPATVVVTVVVTETTDGGTTTRTTTMTSTVSATATATTTTASAGTGVAPVKPTLTATTTTDAATLPAGYCPTGYYACLASAGGGCCQTGRDCQTTSCPPAAALSTIVNVNGFTVVVPSSAAAAAAASSTCAAGWFLCGSAAGPVAGCCPSGYSCGTASCTLVSASSTGLIQKELPTAGSASSSAAARIRMQAWVSWPAAAAAWTASMFLLR